MDVANKIKHMAVFQKIQLTKCRNSKISLLVPFTNNTNYPKGDSQKKKKNTHTHK